MIICRSCQVDACLTIYCALMPTCRAWLSLHLLFSAYLHTTYTYKRMRLFPGDYNIKLTEGVIRDGNYIRKPPSLRHVE